MKQCILYDVSLLQMLILGVSKFFYVDNIFQYVPHSVMTKS